MGSEATPVVAMMGAAIAALFSFLIWMFRLVLNRQDARIALLEDRETKSLETIARNAEIAASGIHALADAIKELRLLFLGLRSDADRR